MQLHDKMMHGLDQAFNSTIRRYLLLARRWKKIEGKAPLLF